MKVTFRLNDKIARNCFGKKGEAKDWLRSLSKYLSDEASVELSVKTNKHDNDASLLIKDYDKRLFVKSNREDMTDAINSVINIMILQLVKNNEKKEKKESNPYKDLSFFKEIDDKIKTNAELSDAYNILELEKN